jgi:uncharacterized repeat protein (TIGR01451 family)
MIAVKNSRIALLAALAAVAVFSLAGAASALAAPRLAVDSTSNSTVAPGGTLTYLVLVRNTSTEASSGELTLTAQLPAPFRALDAGNVDFFGTPSSWTCTAQGGGAVAGAGAIECKSPSSVKVSTPSFFLLDAEVEAGAPEGRVTAAFSLEGGGAAPVAGADATLIASTAPAFGVEAIDARAEEASGASFARAAGHPYDYTTYIDFDTETNPNPAIGVAWPVAQAKDTVVDLPPGLVGNPTTAEQCSNEQLANGNEGRPSCPVDSQVGDVALRFNNSGLGITNLFGPLAVYEMTTAPGEAARFGFNVGGFDVSFDATVRSGSDYGLTAHVTDIPDGLPIAGSTLTLWGVPPDASHEALRSCPAELPPWVEGASPCPSTVTQPAPFFRMPTSCAHEADGLTTTLHTDSWVEPGGYDSEGEPAEEAAWQTATSVSHEAPGSPFAPSEWGAPQGPSNCAAVPFTPTITAQATTQKADSPSGLDVDLHVPQSCWDAKSTAEEAEESICQSDLREAVVKLPAGMTVNPASAAGQQACTPAQIGLKTAPGQSPAHFSGLPANCPEASKIGTTEITTPLLDHPVKGSVYLASQGQNPFGSLLAIYMAFADPASGVVIKQAGHVVPGPDGQLTTTVEEAPQLPFEDFKLEFFGGERASLMTPPTCGSYAVAAKLVPWSGNGAVEPAVQPFQVTKGPNGGACPNGGFAPKLSAGTQNPLAGNYSPFNLKLSREDGTQLLGGLSAKLPEGLLAKLAGVPYCPDSVLNSLPKEANGEALLGSGNAQIANPSCPAASQVGTVTVGAGAGATPFYTSAGRAYLAGPYKGAPLSLAVIAPAVAGPFDLGSVLVRNALHIDPETAVASAVSDPFPTILHGIPLDLRDVRVELNRPSFTLNPTSCDPMAIDAAVSSTQGATANLSSRFQVGNCEKLAFKPKLSLRLKGKTRRGGHPALTAVLGPRPGDANPGKVIVALPHSEFLAQSHIRTICTRVQFAADACPAGSVYGKVSATSPILDYPLEGDVYLRSSSHNLPDLVLKLKGPASQPIEVDSIGRIDSIHGGIRTSFAQVPDAPLSKVVLRMRGGKKSLLENSRDICAHAYRATVKMDGHNGKTHDFHPALRPAGCAKHRKHDKHKHHAR